MFSTEEGNGAERSGKALAPERMTLKDRNGKLWERTVRVCI